MKKPEKKAVMGRPKAKIVRDKYLRVRFSAKEIESINAAAADAGLRQAAYVRLRLKLPSTGYDAEWVGWPPPLRGSGER